LGKSSEKSVTPENLYLLNGSATKKMVKELKKVDYFGKSKPQMFEDLKSLFRSVRRSLATNYELPVTVLFSPGATSFEKFKNEFDRGEKFNQLSLSAF
jgi:UDP-N-acetylmuramoylalanine-D-glutamate ligase